jgi:hypothetical protein
MNASKLSALCLVTLSLAVGCSTGADDGASESEGAVTMEPCMASVIQSAMKEAWKINEEATNTGVKKLYGDDRSYADAMLVRVSDETDPSDYVVFRSRLRDGVVTPSQCSIEKVIRVADGLVPDDGLINGTIGKLCESSIHEAVLEQAVELSETANITGTKLVYGGDRSYGGAAIVRVSDETEPSDYLAVFSLDGSEQAHAGACNVEFVKIVNSGLLPKIDGL